jgi:hypothetical protein
MVYTSLNSWSEAIVLMISVKKIAPLIIGTVMLRNCCQALAPSIFAASYSSPGTFRSAAK